MIVTRKDVVGLDPRKSFFSPIDVIGLGGAVKAYKGARVITKAYDVRKLERVRESSQIFNFGKSARVHQYASELRRGYSLGQSGVRQMLTGARIKGAQVTYLGIRDTVSRVRSKSYQQTERLGTTTTRIPGAKRSTVPKKTSRRTAFSGDARRRTTYCKRHKQYDFCQKYNIRK